MRNVPNRIDCDETLIPAGPRVLYAPRPLPKQGEIPEFPWYMASVMLVFFLGFATALLAVGVTLRLTQARPFRQPAVPPGIEQRVIPGAAALATGGCIPSMEPCQ